MKVLQPIMALLAGLGIILIIFPTLAVLTLLAVLPVLNPEHRCARRIIAGSLRSCFALGRILNTLQIDFEELKKVDGPAIYVGNHPGCLDAMVFLAFLPNATCVAKGSYFNNALTWGWVRAAGFIRNDHKLSAVRGMSDAVKNGSNLIMFPEGTRNPGAPVGPIYSGYALASKRSERPVHVYHFSYPDWVLVSIWDMWTALRSPIQIQVKYHSTLKVEKDSSIENVNTELLGLMQNAYEEDHR